MTYTTVATPTAYAGSPRRGPITRLLEDERWLAMTLLLPTVALLGLFIAYPFIEGVRLAVTDAKGLISGQKFNDLNGDNRGGDQRDGDGCNR